MEDTLSESVLPDDGAVVPVAYERAAQT